METFKHEQLSQRLYRILDFTGVCCYLAIGEKRAVLLDTINGIGDLRSYAESLTDKPIFVILTHGHLDHMGGAAQFDEVYMNPLDWPVMQAHSDMDFRVNDTNTQLRDHPPLTASDFVPAMTKEPLPLTDGQCFDLGGLTVKMISVPGHTPGMMCPLLVEERTILFGDACGVSVLLFDQYSSTVSEYRKSLLHLKEYEGEYDRIYRNHGTFWSNKVLLDNVIECCDDILAHTDDHFPVSIHGFDLFAAHRPAASGHGRADGKEGNILYAPDKVK